MDYAFAPGRTPQDQRLRIMLPRRPNMRLVEGERIRTLQDFIKHLRKTPSTPNIVLPVSDLVVGSHANDEGHLFLDMDEKASSPITYEKLQEVRDRGSIKFAASDLDVLIQSGARFHFKGCRVGAVLPFLKLIKEALGDVLNVTAPKYFHGLYKHPNGGIFEYMSHSYQVVNKVAFTDRAAAVADFKAKNFKRYDQETRVPDSDWEKWIPKGANMKPALKDNRYGLFPVKIVHPEVPVTAIDDLNCEWRARAAKYVAQPINYTAVGHDPPTDPAARDEIEKTSLKLHDTFKDNHPYPVHKRLGFQSFDEFFAGHTWKYAYRPKKMLLDATAIRYEYTLAIPVVKPGTADELVFNYHPTNGAPIINFKEDNAQFDFFQEI